MTDIPAGLAARTRAFVEAELLPVERDLLARPWSDAEPELLALRERARAAGLVAPHLPAALGGQGLALPAFALVSAELGRSPFGHFVANCQAPDVGNMELLHAHGSPAQQAAWLAPLAAGRLRSCFAMTEPGRAGSNPVWLDTRAATTADGWSITGHKWFTTGADGAAVTVVMAVTDPEAPPHQRASLFLVPAGTPGMTLVRNVPVMGEPGGGLSSHGELRFEDCRVPADALLGARGAGFALAQERLGPGRVHHCMRWIGIGERALELLVARARSRELAPGEVLGGRQVVRHWIAEMRAELWAARALVLDVAGRIERDGASAAREEVSVIKYFVAGVLQRALDG